MHSDLIPPKSYLVWLFTREEMLVLATGVSSVVKPLHFWSHTNPNSF